MIDALLRTSLARRGVVLFLVAVAAGIGAWSYQRLPIDAVPDITDNQVQVITSVPSLGAPDVERLITFPIEQATSNIPGLHEIRSFSRFGLSLITIVFEDNIDIFIVFGILLVIALFAAIFYFRIIKRKTPL